MATLDVFNLKREKVGTVDLADEVFAAEVKEHLFYEVVKAQLASRRAGTAGSKNRSAVAGSTKKRIKQKGTGGARHGTIRAPIYVGGGQAHGPRPRDWSYRPPRQVRIGALRSALSKFAKEGRLVVVDAFTVSEIKTKGVLSALATLKTDKKTMIVDSASNENLRLSIRNCEDHQFLPPEGVNVYDLLRHDTLVLSKDAAKALELRCLDRGAEEMITSETIIRRPIFLTEKSNTLRGQNQVVFEVLRGANKIQIKTAVQTLFNVKVESVNTMVYRGKDRRMGRGYAKMQNWKKAVVTLAEGENIDFFAESSES